MYGITVTVKLRENQACIARVAASLREGCLTTRMLAVRAVEARAKEVRLTQKPGAVESQ